MGTIFNGLWLNSDDNVIIKYCYGVLLVTFNVGSQSAYRQKVETTATLLEALRGHPQEHVPAPAC